jgi:hypothetical protein
MKPKLTHKNRVDSGDSEVVYRSGLLYESDMVADALKHAGIPYFRREESSSGLSFAMPVAPVQGPGVTWAIVVPGTVLRQARRVIARLPVSKDMHPGVWGFKPTPAVQRFFRQYAALYIGVILIGWAVSLTGFCRAR